MALKLNLTFTKKKKIKFYLTKIYFVVAIVVMLHLTIVTTCYNSIKIDLLHVASQNAKTKTYDDNKNEKKKKRKLKINSLEKR